MLQFFQGHVRIVRLLQSIQSIEVNKMNFCYFKGEYLPTEKTLLPVTDLIIQRGVGVFDSISTHEKRPVNLTSHLERLFNSACSCGIEPPVSMDALSKLIREGISRFKTPQTEVVIRPYITGGDKYDEKKGKFTDPRFFIMFQETVKPEPDLYKKGIWLKTVNAARPMPETKSVNYMLAFRENSKSPEVYEILYCPEGEITESSHSSFFMVKEGRLITAPDERVLPGTTRKIILTIASEQGMETSMKSPLLSEVPEAEEAFITGSIKGVLPVTKINDTVIGKGKPGKFTRKLHQLYRENIHRWL